MRAGNGRSVRREIELEKNAGTPGRIEQRGRRDDPSVGIDAAQQCFVPVKVIGAISMHDGLKMRGKTTFTDHRHRLSASRAHGYTGEWLHSCYVACCRRNVGETEQRARIVLLYRGQRFAESRHHCFAPRRIDMDTMPSPSDGRPSIPNGRSAARTFPAT